MKRAALLRLAGLRGRFFNQLKDDLSTGALSEHGDSSFYGHRPPPSSADLRRRVTQPMVRRSYYENRLNSDRTLRGQEPFVAVGWDEALDLVAESLASAKASKGNQSVYAYSGGLDDASCFPGQYHLHRFLGSFGGYTESVGSYSYAAAEVLIPHILGMAAFKAGLDGSLADEALKDCKRIVYFGNAGGVMQRAMDKKAVLPASASRLNVIEKAGIPVVSVSPVRDGAYADLRVCWLQCRPNSDVAVMLALVHTLIDEGLYDTDFVAKYCVGFDIFASYVMGESDGLPKDASWAEAKSEVPAHEILMLARLMAAERCMLELCASLQNAEHGEQSYWVAIALAAALGYIGLPGGGLLLEAGIRSLTPMQQLLGAFSSDVPAQFEHGVSDFVPLARIADMLESPGSQYSYNGQERVYPDIDVLYWGGGDPLRDHPDINRLRTAWRHPRSVIVHSANWTTTACFADIVLPSTSTIHDPEMPDDATAGKTSSIQRFERQFSDAWDDYDIFSALADRFDFYNEFTEGRNAAAWARVLYRNARKTARATGLLLPDYELLKAGAWDDLTHPLHAREQRLEQFRADPARYPLSTPSGKIEVFSKTIAGYGYADCAGHPTWFEKDEWLGSPLTVAYPYHLVFAGPPDQMRDRRASNASTGVGELADFDIIRIHAEDAYFLDVTNGECVRVFNTRGSFIARALVSNSVRKRVMQIEPDLSSPSEQLIEGGRGFFKSFNSVTSGAGASSLSQGPTRNSCLVNVEKIDHPAHFADFSSIPTILYNLSPTAFRSASRR